MSLDLSVKCIQGSPEIFIKEGVNIHQEDKPTVFIGSSSEGLDIAKAIQHKLSSCAKVVVWTDGVFELSKSYLESLLQAVNAFDFAIFVLSADDALTSRGVDSITTRGNVVFELGLFLGKLGASRTFAVYDTHKKPSLISDLHGISLAEYNSRSDTDLLNMVSSSCFLIEQNIKKWSKKVQRSKILILASIPKNIECVSFDSEIKEIAYSLREARKENRLSYDLELAVCVDDLSALLFLYKPTLLHIICAGTNGNLILEDENRKPKEISRDLLCGIISEFSETIKCVIINSCTSTKLAEQLNENIDFTIGTHQLSDKAAIAFSKGFYNAIGNGASYETAFNLGKIQMELI